MFKFIMFKFITVFLKITRQDMGLTFLCLCCKVLCLLALTLSFALLLVFYRVTATLSTPFLDLSC